MATEARGGVSIMNSQDRDEMTRLSTRVGNIEKQLETIITNHLPHITEVLATIREKLGDHSGTIRVATLLILLLLSLLVGLYFR